ncbi:hypothetical protein NA57DRAFT_56662 [Rhizodiscina lignyota]|uniref:EKC/KEOPS complex subunit BUD32 n=1 Tax=Rhizodiscina lignyota TaxID=1504668 RepID=A0A9P4IFG9_9PEZI|nr:hypothetical protein NA57DRAFT_56662 [Rhizodiscina lignyota]
MSIEMDDSVMYALGGGSSIDDYINQLDEPDLQGSTDAGNGFGPYDAGPGHNAHETFSLELGASHYTSPPQATAPHPSFPSNPTDQHATGTSQQTYPSQETYSTSLTSAVDASPFEFPGLDYCTFSDLPSDIQPSDGMSPGSFPDCLFSRNLQNSSQNEQDAVSPDIAARNQRKRKKKNQDVDGSDIDEHQLSPREIEKIDSIQERLNTIASEMELPVSAVLSFLKKRSNKTRNATHDCGNRLAQSLQRGSSYTYSSSYVELEPPTNPLPISTPSSDLRKGSPELDSSTKTWNDYIEKSITKKDCKRTAVNQTRDNQPNDGTWECTWGCEKRFKGRYEWERHEEMRQPQAVYLCILCRREGRKDPKLFLRKDKMRDHLVRAQVHAQGRESTEKLVEQSFFSRPVNARLFEPRCGFGGYKFKSWKDRLNHLHDHFHDYYESRNGTRYIRDWPEQDPDSCKVRKASVSNTATVPAAVGNCTTITRPSSALSPSSISSSPAYFMNDATSTSGSGAPHRAIHNAARFTFAQRIDLLGALVLPFSEQSDSFENVQTLGCGTFTWVEEIRHGPTGFSYAQKLLREPGATGVDLAHFQREIEILQLINHPSCVRFVAGLSQGPRPTLLMEPVADFDLERYLLDPKHYSSVQRHELLAGLIALVDGLVYLHQKRILHNDIRPDNILIARTKFLYADFGSSTTERNSLTTKMATRPIKISASDMPQMFSAPEALSSSIHTMKSDIFSLGAVFAEVLVILTQGSVQLLREHLVSRVFSQNGHQFTRRRLSATARYLNRQLERAANDQCDSLFEGLWVLAAAMLNPLPSARPTALQIAVGFDRLLNFIPRSLSLNWATLHFSEDCTGWKKTTVPNISPQELGKRQSWRASDLLLRWGIAFPPPALSSPDFAVTKSSSHQSVDHSGLPSKLLEISTVKGKVHRISLVETSSFGPGHWDTKYAVFTDHSWLRISPDTVEDARSLASGTWLEPSSLGLSMQHAIAITVQLHVNFLWVKEICSAEHEDTALICSTAFAIIIASTVAPVSENQAYFFRRSTYRLAKPGEHLSSELTHKLSIALERISEMRAIPESENSFAEQILAPGSASWSPIQSTSQETLASDVVEAKSFLRSNESSWQQPENCAKSQTSMPSVSQVSAESAGDVLSPTSSHDRSRSSPQAPYVFNDIEGLILNRNGPDLLRAYIGLGTWTGNEEDICSHGTKFSWWHIDSAASWAPYFKKFRI